MGDTDPGGSPRCRTRDLGRRETVRTRMGSRQRSEAAGCVRVQLLHLQSFGPGPRPRQGPGPKDPNENGERSERLRATPSAGARGVTAGHDGGIVRAHAWEVVLARRRLAPRRLASHRVRRARPLRPDGVDRPRRRSQEDWRAQRAPYWVLAARNHGAVRSRGEAWSKTAKRDGRAAIRCRVRAHR